MSKLPLLTGKKLATSKVAKIIEREIVHSADPIWIKRVLGGLRSPSAFFSTAGVVLKRLEPLLNDLPRLVLVHATERRKTLTHLFLDTPRSDPAWRQYRGVVNELKRLIGTPDFQTLLLNKKSKEVIEESTRLMYVELAGTVDSYQNLRQETETINSLVQHLYPKDYPSLRIDAHHIIEDRTFEKFKDTWGLIGWKTPDDMAALPILYELHIRSPRRLPDIQEVGKRLNVGSLTDELKKAIQLDKIKDTNQLLSAYEDFYRRTMLWPHVKPALKAVDREITRRRTLAGIGKKAKTNK